MHDVRIGVFIDCNGRGGVRDVNVTDAVLAAGLVDCLLNVVGDVDELLSL